MRVALALVAVPLLASPARADQCAWIDHAVAHRAAAILATQPKVIAFCEPCGEQAPGVPRVASTAALRSPEPGYQEVHINGVPVDLAYTFVQTSPERYQNLAALAGCPADGVSPSLTVTDETPTGVLIVADDPPATPPPTIAAPAPPLPAPPPTVYVFSSTITHEVSWPALLLGGAGGVAAGTLGLFMVGALRRRRTLRPRAAELPIGRHDR